MKVQFPAGVVIASLPTDSMPDDTGLALSTTGVAYGWGRNDAGQLCQPTLTVETPVAIPISGTVTALAGAGDHALYVTGGSVFACGANQFGDLGNGTNTPSRAPVAVATLPGNVVSVYASCRNSSALTADGHYYSWGWNGLGNVGNGSTADAWTPQLITLPAAVSSVALGGSVANHTKLDNGSTLVKLVSGALYSWGDDQFGELGDGQLTNEPSPVQWAPPLGVAVASLCEGGATSYIVDTSGNVWAWGWNNAGQIGNGARTAQRAPIEVESGAAACSATASDVVTLGAS